jgi:NAD-dependent dihydropyrimidine dehydrogenase PreA subunit
VVGSLARAAGVAGSTGAGGGSGARSIGSGSLGVGGCAAGERGMNGHGGGLLRGCWLRTPRASLYLTSKGPTGASMTYTIAEPCIDVKDKACVEECPVDCIYEGPRMLYIHPEECIDCGACEPVCPSRRSSTRTTSRTSGRSSRRSTPSSSRTRSRVSARPVAPPAVGAVGRRPPDGGLLGGLTGQAADHESTPRGCSRGVSGGSGPCAILAAPWPAPPTGALDSHDLRDRRALRRRQGPGVRAGVPRRLHLRGGPHALHPPHRVHRLRGVRARVPGRGDLLRGRPARRVVDVQADQRRVLRRRGHRPR